MNFAEFGKQYIPRIDRYLEDFFSRKAESAPLPVLADLYGDLREFINRDGKRIRPLLLLAGYAGYGGGRDDEAVPVASILEMMHAMLLIQDDIIDKAALRRGKPALHLLLGEKYSSYTYTDSIGVDIALVLADILFADSLEIVSGSPFDGETKDRFLNIFARTYRVTAWGQILDSLYSLSRDPLGADDVPRTIGSMKTAYYTILYPLQMGHVLSGSRDGSEPESLERFALPLGSAFQVRDDILGLFGTEASLGKSADSDLQEGKLTLLVQHALGVMDGAARQRFLRLFQKREKTAGDIAALRGMIGETGAKERALQELSRLTGEARTALAGLAMAQQYREVLAGLIELVAAP